MIALQNGRIIKLRWTWNRAWPWNVIQKSPSFLVLYLILCFSLSLTIFHSGDPSDHRSFHSFLPHGFRIFTKRTKFPFLSSTFSISKRLLFGSLTFASNSLEDLNSVMNLINFLYAWPLTRPSMIVDEFWLASIFEQQKTTGSSIFRKILKRSIDLHFQSSFQSKKVNYFMLNSDFIKLSVSLKK